MKKIILLKGQVETLEFFSKRLNIYLKKLGYETFIFDLQGPEEQIEELENFVEFGNTTLLTYNFNGISGENIFLDEQGKLFFDAFLIRCVNIVVDHPMYYYKYYNRLPKDYHQINIDRTHKQYMQEYYENVDANYFVPLCGTRLKKDIKSIREKDMDLVFTGNYTPPSTFLKYIKRIDKEYEDFYMGIIDDLIANNNKTMEEVFNEHIKREEKDVSKKELCLTHSNMTFIDLYVRFYYREKVIKEICESGIKIDIYGAGYELMDCKNKDNMIIHGSQNTKGCIDAIYNSKMSLNVMPWFKDGAHDRVYTTMLNGTVCITDKSKYLIDELEDGKDICFYDLSDIKKVPKWINKLLKDEELMAEIAYNGERKASRYHTFKNVVDELINIL